jgi:hypothetical protein
MTIPGALLGGSRRPKGKPDFVPKFSGLAEAPLEPVTRLSSPRLKYNTLVLNFTQGARNARPREERLNGGHRNSAAGRPNAVPGLLDDIHHTC